MLKGCQKKIIVMKNTGSPIFEEAYFILSENAQRAHTSERDMISEANRIIRESGAGKADRFAPLYFPHPSRSFCSRRAFLSARCEIAAPGPASKL